MILKLRKLQKKYNVTTLKNLSEELNISLDKIKNISCGRTSFGALFQKKNKYRVFPLHCKELAELIGIVLGDGNISQFDRCQRLAISCNGSYGKYIKYVTSLVGNIFGKEPHVIKRLKANCCDIYLYLRDIDKALGLPVGNKIKNSVKIPRWVFKKKLFLIKCLKGLFETDGHYAINKKYYVEYIQFCNESLTLKGSAFRALKYLGYSPQLGRNYVRLAKKREVHRFIKEMHFVRPFPSLVNNGI